jgi:hypothetical protein
VMAVAAVLIERRVLRALAGKGNRT